MLISWLKSDYKLYCCLDALLKPEIITKHLSKLKNITARMRSIIVSYVQQHKSHHFFRNFEKQN